MGNSGNITIQTGTATMYEDLLWKTEIIWDKKYAYFPTKTEEGWILFNPYYIKTMKTIYANQAKTVDTDYSIIKITSKPAEYILFGENNEKKI